MGVSNYLIGILNFITALLSVPIIGAGIWLARKAHETECVRLVQGPVIAVGVLILLVSLAGLLGAGCRKAWLLWLYLVAMVLLILLLFCFTVFTFVVTNKGAGDAVSGKGFREYHLGEYSTWLQRHVVDRASRWEKIKSCLADAHICQSLDTKYPTQQAFDNAVLSPIQSGCCKPPSSCGYSFVKPTNWSNAVTNVTPINETFPDSDCAVWSNDPSQLCFECAACKAGVLQSAKKDWRKVAMVNIVMLVFLIVVYSVGCCAIRNVRRRKHYGYV